MNKSEYFKYIVIGITSQIDLRKSITKIRVLCKLENGSYYWADSNNEDDKVYWWQFNLRDEAESKAKKILGNNYFTYGISFEQGLYPMKIWKWFEK